MKASKFFLSTFIAAAAMTSTAFAESTTTVDKSTIYVNSSYTSQETVGENMIFSENAFAQFDSAVRGATSDTSTINVEGTVAVESDLSYQTLPSNIKISSVGGGVVDFGSKTLHPYNGGSLTIGENVSLTNVGQMIAYEAEVVINGNWQGAHLWTFGGADKTKLTINETAKVNIGEQLEFRGGVVTISGVLDSTEGVLGNADQIQVLGTTYGAWGGSSGYYTEVNMNDTYVKLAQNTIGGSGHTVGGFGAVVTMKNSILEIASEGRLAIDTNGKLDVTNGSILAVSTSATTFTNKGTLNIDASTLTAGTLTNSGDINVDDSDLNIKTLTGVGRVVANGVVNFNVDSVENTRLFFGRTYDANGNKVMNPERSTIVMDSMTEGGNISVMSNIFNFNNSDLIVNKDISIVVTQNSTFQMNNSAVDLKGNTMNLSGHFIFGGVTLKNGTYAFDVSGTSAPTSCFQIFGEPESSVDANKIASDAKLTIKNGPFGFYANADIEGEFIGENISNSINIGVNSIIEGEPFIEDVVVNVTGSFATDGSVRIYGQGKDLVDGSEEVGPSELNIKQGGSFSANSVTNNGIITVDGAESFSVGNLTNNGSLTVIDATVTVTEKFTNNGSLIIEGNGKIATLADGETSSGVALGKDVSVTLKDGDVEVSVKMGSAETTFAGATAVDVSASDLGISDNKSVAFAWDIDVEGSATVSTEVATGLSLETIQIFHKGDEEGAQWYDVTSEVKVAYDAETGLLSFTTGDFSSYAVVVPEPSAFGLLAGLGALALVAARRRRR